MDNWNQWRAAACSLVFVALSLSGCGGGGGSDDDDDDTGGSGSGPGNSLRTSCVAPDRPNIDTGIDFLTVNANAERFVSKLLIEPAPPRRWFQLTRDGVIHTYDRTGGAQPDEWIDISDFVYATGNGGLVSMVFHPDYPATPEVFVWYSSGTDDAFVMNLDRISVDNTDNPSSFNRENILTINQVDTIHQGGDLVFGSDGYLYLSQGDSGVVVAGSGAGHALPAGQSHAH